MATAEEVAFDDVQLTVALANPIAIPGGPYNVVYNATLTLNGSASVPSDGQTITSYEWDLDDDGDFDEGITVANPAAIPYATLIAAPPTGYGMAEGANTIRLRVTDSSAKISTVNGTVNLGGPMVIYESFADANATLIGNTPGVGLTGTWAASETTWGVTNPGFFFGTIAASGNRAEKTSGTTGRGANSILTGTVSSNSLKDSGLLNHGATLWFSFLWKMDNAAVSNGDAGFALGTASLTGPNAIPMASSGNGIGVSLSTSAGTIAASSWSGGTRTSGSTSAFNRTSARLVVGKIDWGADGASNDTVSIYLPSTDLALPGSPVSTRSAVLDQSLFNTISFASKNEGKPAIDEIRFGVSYADVAPVDTSPLTLAPANIVDNKAGGPVLESETLVYAFNFNKNLNPATVDANDFQNGGTSPITINSVTVSGNQVTVTVTPAFPGAAGTLQMQVKSGAVISDFAGTQSLDTTSAIADDTVITVNADTVLPTVTSITSPTAASPIYGLAAIPYVVTFSKYFMDDATVNTADFTNAGTASITVNSVTKTSTGTAPATYAVSVTPTSTGTLQLQLSGTVQDVIGNAVATPVVDDYTYTFASPEPAKQTITVDSVLDIALRVVAGSTKDFTFNASASDKLVVIVTGEHNFGGDLSGNVTSITYDGVALTKAVERHPFSSTLQTVSEMWYLDDPAAATASASLSDPAPATTGSIRIVVTGNGTNYVHTAFALSGTAPGFAGASSIAIGTQSTNLLVSSPNSKVVSWLTLGGSGNTATTAETITANSPVGAITFGSKRQANNYAGHALAHTSGLTPGMQTFSFNTTLTDVYCIAAEFLAADVVVGSPYTTWTAGPFASTLTNTSASLDFDNGGLDTGIEWVVGGDPTNGSDDAGKTPTFNNSDPNNFVFTYLRRDAANTDPNTTIAVEYGTNLTGWTTATHGVNGVSIDDTNVPSPGFRTVVVTIPKALAGPGGKLFARLNVVVNP